MHDLSMGQRKTSKTIRAIESIRNSRVEVRKVAMNFVVGFPKSAKSHHTIWVIVDRLTK